MHSKDEVRRGVYFSPQKHKLLEEISKSGDKNQGNIFKKVKSSDESNDFILKDYTIMTRLKLAYQKVQHDLNYITVSS